MSYLFLENGDLLESTELEISLNEGFLTPLPKEIKDLKEKMDEYRKEFIKNNKYQKGDNVSGVVNSFKDRSKYTNASNRITEKAIFDMLKKFDIKLLGYSKWETSTNGVPTNYEFKLTGLYKDYIIYLSINQPASSRTFYISILSVKYDKNACSIPKDVVLDVISILGGNVDSISSSKNSVKISPKYSTVKQQFHRIESKYSDKYNVKQNLGAFSVTISEKK